MREVEPYMALEAERANLGGLSMRSVDTATDTITYVFAKGTVTVSLSKLTDFRFTRKR
jgi:hypothetical protein